MRPPPQFAGLFASCSERVVQEGTKEGKEREAAPLLQLLPPLRPAAVD
jgi:hypothetical protein